MMPDLNYLSTLDDPEADPLVEEMAKRGMAPIAALLDNITRWNPRDPLPADPAIPTEVQQKAEAFLRREGVLDDAFGSTAVVWERIEQAQERFSESRLSGLMVLGCASLPACYAHPSIALLLTGSGRLVVQVTRRLRETIDFLLVMMTPGSLRRGGAGVAWIRKVRLMHALMRKLALASAGSRSGDKLSDFLLRLDWRARFASRKPIDQVELAYVLQTFGWLLVRGFDLLGIELGESERNDHIYTWAVIGHGLGIVQDLRPQDAAAARKLFEDIQAAREEGTEEGRLLTAALIVFVVLAQQEQVKSMPARMQTLYRWFQPFADACFQSLARTLIRSLTGRKTAQRLWVPRAPFVHWVVGVALRAVMTLMEMRTAADWMPWGKKREKGLPPALGARLEALAAWRR